MFGKTLPVVSSCKQEVNMMLNVTYSWILVDVM